MTRRLVVMVLACAIAVVGIAVPAPRAMATVVATESAVEFTDVESDQSFAREIAWLGNSGISSGWLTASGREYRPYARITRDAMAAFLYRAAGSPDFTAPTASPFVDVSPLKSSPGYSAFYKEITWLASTGVSTGWDVGGGLREYRPTARITRDAMAAFLYRAAGSPSFAAPTVSPFTDVSPNRSDDVYSAFYAEITWLASTGVSSGWTTSDGAMFRPVAQITRDAMAAFLYRYSAEVVPEDASDPESGTVAVAPDVEVLDDEMSAEATVAGGTVTMSEAAASSVRVNDVVAAAPSESLPDGLLVRVEGVTRWSDGSVQLETVPATVADAIVTTNGAIDAEVRTLSSTFTPEDGVIEVAAGAVAPVARSVTAEVDRDLGSHTFTWGASGEATAVGGNGALTGKGSYLIGGETTVSATATALVDIGLGGVNELRFAVEAGTHSKLGIDVAGSFEGELVVPIGSLDQAVVVVVGTVPIPVTLHEELNASVSVEGEASVELYVTNGASSEFGFEYDHGDFALLDSTPQVQGNELTAKASASLTARVGLEVAGDVKFAGVAGLTASVEPYATAAIGVTVDISGLEWECPYELGIATKLGVVAGIDMWGMTLGDWRKTKDVDWPLYEGDPCAGSPVEVPEGDPLAIATAELPDAVLDEEYSAQLSAFGGDAPYTWTATGLPDGFAIDGDGAITGTGTEAVLGEHTVHATVRDVAGAQASADVTFTVRTAGRADGQTITLLSVDADGMPSEAYLSNAVLSGDGSHAAFDAAGFGLGRVDSRGIDISEPVVVDIATGATTRVAVLPDGTLSASDGWVQGLSADGGQIYFVSTDRGLDPEASFEGVTGHPASPTVYVRDLDGEVTQALALLPDGSAALDGSSLDLNFRSPISADGRYAVFHSNSPSLLDGWAGQSTASTVTEGYVRDLENGTTALVTTDDDGVASPDGGTITAISPDGNLVLFASTSPDLDADHPCGTVSRSLLYVKEMDTGEVHLVTPTAEGSGCSVGYAVAGDIANDGTVVFPTTAGDVVSGDIAWETQGLAVRNIYEGVTRRLAVGYDGAYGDCAEGVSRRSITPDGSTVLIQSCATNLVEGVTGGPGETGDYGVYLVDIATGAIRAVATGADSAVFSAALSADGTRATIFTEATNLTDDVIPSGTRQVYLVELN